MLQLLQLIPIVGQLIEAGTAIIKGRQETEVKKKDIEAGVTKEAFTATNTIATAFISDVWVRVCRDLFMTMGTVYCTTIVWDRWVDIKYPWLVWGVKPLQGPLEYFPYALMAFFFGSAAVWAMRK